MHNIIDDNFITWIAFFAEAYVVVVIVGIIGNLSPVEIFVDKCFKKCYNPINTIETDTPQNKLEKANLQMVMRLREERRSRPTDAGLSEEVLTFYEKLYNDNLEFIKKLKKSIRSATANLRYHSKIVNPGVCAICEGQGKVGCHHPNYLNSELVIWVCRTCHWKQLRNITKRRRRAIDAFLYLSRKVKERPEYRRFKEAEDALTNVATEIFDLNPDDKEEIASWKDRRIATERKVWSAEWRLKRAFTDIASNYDRDRDGELY